MNDFRVNTVNIVELDTDPPLCKRSVTPMAKAGVSRI